MEGVNSSEVQVGRPFELPSWNIGQGNGDSVLGAVFSFPSAEPLMIPEAKGAL